MAELRYTYLLDVKDMASRQVAQANAKIAGSVERTNVAMRQQGTVAENASRKVQTAGARQAAEWKQVERAARTAERSVAQASTQASATVTRATEKQVAMQRKAGASYAQIARAQKAAGVSARETAAAIEQSAARERRALDRTASSTKRSRTGFVGGLKEQAAGLKGMLGGLAAGFAAFKAADFLRDAVDETTKLAKATRGLQNITGQDARTASSWVQIAKQRGLSTRQLNQAFITLERNQTKAAKGSKTQADAFRTLGVSQDQLKKSSPQQLIEKVADGFQRLGPTAQRAAAAQQLFGRGGQLMLGVLKGGSQAVRDQIQVVQRYGASLDRNGVKNALRLVAEQRKLNLAFDGFKITVGQAIIPALTRGAAALSKFIAQMRSGTGTGGQVRKVLEQVGSAAATLAKALGPVARALATAFGPAAKVAATAIGGMSQIIRSLVGIVRGMVGVVTNLLKGNFAGAWRSVKHIVSSALSGIGGLVKTLMAPVYTAVSGVVGRAIKSVGRLGAGIAGAIRGAVGTVGKAAGAVAGAILGAFRTLSRLIAGVWNGIVRIVKGAIGTIKSAIGGIKSAFDKVTSIIPGRTGGVAHPGGFRRYQQGGLVPAMLSPGEMVVHGNAGMVVPGQPTAADNVPMLLPVGAAVLTGDGQRRMAAGASVAQAVASQAPHFRAGGHVRGRVSWFGGPHDSQDSGRTALGLTTATPGVAIRPGDTWQTGRPTLGQYWRVRLRNGRSAVLRQTDLGPNQSTGRRIDITYSALSRFGYREGNFPTDSIGVADLVGKGAAAGAPAAVSRGTPARVTYSPRGRLITSGRAMQLGYEAGLEGGSLYGVYRSVRDAVTYNRTVIPGTPGGLPRTTGGRGGGGRPATRALVAQRRPIRDTWAWARAIAAKFGLTISSSYRTPEHNRAVGGVPNSWHTRGSSRRPEAFDFSGSPGARARAQGWFRRFTHPDETLIHNAGSGMHLHVGGLYRRGGIVGYQAGGYLSGRPVAVAPRQRSFVPAGVPVDRLAGRDQNLQLYLESIQRLKAAQGALLRAGAHDNAAIAKALHDVDRGLQDVGHISYGRLQKMARSLTATIRGTKDPDVARRLKGELRLVFGEMGRRIGLLAKQAADMVDSTVRAATHVAAVLKASKGKIDLTSTTQLSALERASAVSERELRSAIGLLQRAYRRAAKANLKGAMKDLAGRIADLMGQLSQVIADAASAAVDAAAQIGQNRHTSLDQFARSVNAGLTMAGYQGDSAEAILAQYKVQGKQTEQLQADKRQLEEWMKWAAGSGNQQAVATLQMQLQETNTQIAESLATMTDLARQGQTALPQAEINRRAAEEQAQAARDAAQAARDQAQQAADQAASDAQARRQAIIDAAQAGVSLAQAGLQHLGLEQKLAGTYEGGGQARADYIAQRVIPAIQAEIDAMKRNGASATDIMNAQNDLLQAQLDAQDEIKKNTEDTADALKNLGGTLGFEFQGTRLTDDLLASSVGA